MQQPSHTKPYVKSLPGGSRARRDRRRSIRSRRPDRTHLAPAPHVLRASRDLSCLPRHGSPRLVGGAALARHPRGLRAGRHVEPERAAPARRCPAGVAVRRRPLRAGRAAARERGAAGDRMVARARLLARRHAGRARPGGGQLRLLGHRRGARADPSRRSRTCTPSGGCCWAPCSTSTSPPSTSGATTRAWGHPTIPPPRASARTPRAFLVRTVPAQFRSAWRLETKRLGDEDMRWSDPRILGSRVLHGLVVEWGVALLIGLALGPAAFFAYVLQAVVAVRLLEAVNYFEHWGIVRDRLAARARSTPGTRTRGSRSTRWSACHGMPIITRAPRGPTSSCEYVRRESEAAVRLLRHAWCSCCSPTTCSAPTPRRSCGGGGLGPFAPAAAEPAAVA